MPRSLFSKETEKHHTIHGNNGNDEVLFPEKLQQREEPGGLALSIHLVGWKLGSPQGSNEMLKWLGLALGRIFSPLIVKFCFLIMFFIIKDSSYGLGLVFQSLLCNLNPSSELVFLYLILIMNLYTEYESLNLGLQKVKVFWTFF